MGLDRSMRAMSFWLRPTLLVTILGLMLMTVVVIAGSAALLTLRNTRELVNQSRIGLGLGDVLVGNMVRRVVSHTQ
jgi:hypothetical protein